MLKAISTIWSHIKDCCTTYDEFGDIGLRQFCQAEYKNEWQYAYRCYEVDGKFPKQGRSLR